MPHHIIHLFNLAGKVHGVGVRRVVGVDQSYNFHLIPLMAHYASNIKMGGVGL